MALALPATRPALRLAGFALLGSWLIAASAQIVLPMWPVPATLQTLAVLLVGALGGPAVGVAAVGAYLAQGAAGLPFFARWGCRAGGVPRPHRGVPARLRSPPPGSRLRARAAAVEGGRGSAGRASRAVRAGRRLALGLRRVRPRRGCRFLVFIPGTLLKTAMALALLRALRALRRAVP
jgi:biotin transport system substrate-specific component